jgi:hypothetical protein
VLTSASSFRTPARIFVRSRGARRQKENAPSGGVVVLPPD